MDEISWLIWAFAVSDAPVERFLTKKNWIRTISLNSSELILLFCYNSPDMTRSSELRPIPTRHPRSDREWIESLAPDHADFNSALTDLREYLWNGIRHTFKGSGKIGEEHLEDFCQEALMRVLSKRNSYSGKSRFTTWAMKVAVNLVLSEIRKKTWQDVSLDAFDDTEPFLDASRGNGLFSPQERKLFRKEMAELCNKLIKESLTDRQRTALVYHMKYGMPLEEIARRTGSTRNSIYKLLHDARMKLKQEFERSGVDRDDISALA